MLTAAASLLSGAVTIGDGVVRLLLLLNPVGSAFSLAASLMFIRFLKKVGNAMYLEEKTGEK